MPRGLVGQRRQGGLGDGIQGAERRRRVHRLEGASQLQVDTGQGPPRSRQPQPLCRDLRRGHRDQHRPALLADARDHIPCLAADRDARDARHAGLDDAGLLRRDLAQSLAQKLGMVQPDVRDDRHQRMRDHICRIQTPAQAHFQHDIIHGPLGEIAYPDGCLQLELRRRPMLGRLQILDMRADNGDPAGEVRARDHFAVDLDTLAHIVDIRREIHPNLVARRLQDGGRHRRRGPFALCPGDMDHTQPLLRVPQSVQQGEEPLVSQLHPQP